MKKILITLVLLLGSAMATVAWYWFTAAPLPAQYRTASVTRGDLRVSISATGTLEPEEVVDIGAQVAGQIDRFGIDPHDSSKPVDYGTAVEEGRVLAHIDESLYGADVDRAQADLASAKATVTKAEADLGQMRANSPRRITTGIGPRSWSRAAP